MCQYLAICWEEGAINWGGGWVSWVDILFGRGITFFLNSRRGDKNDFDEESTMLISQQQQIVKSLVNYIFNCFELQMKILNNNLMTTIISNLNLYS